MKVSLTVLVAGPMEGKAIPITIPRFVIGRAPECNLQPGHPSIGELHCALEVGADQVLVRDLGSASGTFVNERQIQGAFQLRNGDRLKVGPLVFGLTIEAQKVSPPQPAAAPAAPAAPAVRPPAAENTCKVVPDTAEMPADTTAEMNAQTDETVHDTPAKPAERGGKKPIGEGKQASQAAKELLSRYLRRRRSDEPLV